MLRYLLPTTTVKSSNFSNNEANTLNIIASKRCAKSKIRLKITSRKKMIPNKMTVGPLGFVVAAAKQTAKTLLRAELKPKLSLAQQTANLTRQILRTKKPKMSPSRKIEKIASKSGPRSLRLKTKKPTSTHSASRLQTISWTTLTKASTTKSIFPASNPL